MLLLCHHQCVDTPDDAIKIKNYGLDRRAENGSTFFFLFVFKLRYIFFVDTFSHAYHLFLSGGFHVFFIITTQPDRQGSRSQVQ